VKDTPWVTAGAGQNCAFLAESVHDSTRLPSQGLPVWLASLLCRVTENKKILPMARTPESRRQSLACYGKHRA
jgi:hypothetical protein